MSTFLKSTVGKKVVVSLSGLFLLTFLGVHLAANLFLLAGPDAYNAATHFMDTNPIIQIMQPVLALGFLLHIFYAVFMELKNRASRPQKYGKRSNEGNSTWASRNMFVLGFIIFFFLVVHIFNFFAKMKFGEMAEVTVGGEVMHDSYKLVAGLFTTDIFTGSHFVFSIFYIFAAVALGLHLHHALWSAFQTIGMSNQIWRKRLSILGDVYAVIIGAGFAVIPLYFLIFA